MTPQKMAGYADNMRFILDLAVRATDERLSDEDRIEAATELASCSHLHDRLAEVRETFRDIANRRTDRVSLPEGWG